MIRININEIENIKIGNSENFEGGTGCTVVICDRGSPTGLDVRGSAPASREGELTKSFASCEYIHSVLLSGGSAFGLDAAGGVMKYLEEKNVGFDVGVTKVPLVCQSSLFDLTVASKDIRPDSNMAYEACINSEKNNPKMGNYGAGLGATVGKLLGMDYAMKSGLGSYAVKIGEIKIGAIVAVNALGDIFDYNTGEKIAGLLDDKKSGLRNSSFEFLKIYGVEKNFFNTTIGIIITNGKFNKVQMSKIASMAHNGYARTINPVHTSMDGDSIYAMSVGDIKANIDVVGTIAGEVMGLAINDAVLKSESLYGFKSHKDIKNNIL